MIQVKPVPIIGMYTTNTDIFYGDITEYLFNILKDYRTEFDVNTCPMIRMHLIDEKIKDEILDSKMLTFTVKQRQYFINVMLGEKAKGKGKRERINMTIL